MHTLTAMPSTKRSATRWARFVKRHIGNDPQATVAHRTGINQATISRWLRGSDMQPSAQNVVAFARGYGIPPVEALVAAGVITPDEAVA